MDKAPLIPLVYSCSGASSAAQMANHIAIRLDRMGVAEMSCIAGVGGNVKPLVRTARSGRPILALDGCPLHCAARILQRHGIQPLWHVDLSQYGVPKLRHEDFDPQLAARMLEEVRERLRGDAMSRGLGTDRSRVNAEANQDEDILPTPSGSSMSWP